MANFFEKLLNLSRTSGLSEYNGLYCVILSQYHCPNEVKLALLELDFWIKFYGQPTWEKITAYCRLLELEAGIAEAIARAKHTNKLLRELVK